ncbi:hypothetical protein D3C87_1782630 [compost metagenome]
MLAAVVSALACCVYKNELVSMAAIKVLNNKRSSLVIFRFPTLSSCFLYRNRRILMRLFKHKLMK